MFGCRVGMTTQLGWLQLQRTGRRPATTLFLVRCFFHTQKWRNPGPFQNTGSQWIAWRLKRVPFMKMRIGLFPHLVFSVLGMPQEESYPKFPNPMGDPKIFLKSTESTELLSQVNALYSGKAAEAELDVAVAWPVRGSPLIDPNMGAMRDRWWSCYVGYIYISRYIHICRYMYRQCRYMIYMPFIPGFHQHLDTLTSESMSHHPIEEEHRKITRKHPAKYDFIHPESGISQPKKGGDLSIHYNPLHIHGTNGISTYMKTHKKSINIHGPVHILQPSHGNP